ncbi:MAG: adenylate/guanylate cyclase domain-containing protein [Deltaproteobacteria bacterium]|nr:adenylate/guanylate cyclase domain-containing protein [Deltaproteobacteria bacterium]
MLEIFSQTDGQTIQASQDDTILEALQKANIEQITACGGNARCTTCRIHIMEGLSNCRPRNEKEALLAEKMGFPENIRLACQTRIRGNIMIKRPVVDQLDEKIVLKQFDNLPGTRLGQEKDLAILFADIENYTQFAEAFPAYDVVHVLNRYYQTMNEIIVRHNGVISDVAGDGILALFGLIEEGENAVLDAVSAVREMNGALVRFNQYLRKMFDWSFAIRSGINFGKSIVGNFDTGTMRKISAIGDAVNIASRIESANKDFGTKLLISQSAKEEIDGLIAPEQMHLARLKGLKGEHRLYEIEL